MDLTMDEDEQYEQLTAAQVLGRLEESWVNERVSPYLQESQQEVVDCLLEQCQSVEENFSRASPFAVGVHQLEIQRIRYMATDYLRTRLHKIEKHAEYALEEQKDHDGEDAVLKLSPAEFTYAREFHRLVVSTVLARSLYEIRIGSGQCSDSFNGRLYIVHNVLHAVQARHIRSALQSVYGGEMHDSAAGVHFIPILHE
eukprot:sb/3470748/